MEDVSSLRAGQEGTGSVRFVSVQDFSKLIGSVRFGKFTYPVRCGSACVFRTRRGSVQFGSVRFRVRFRPVPLLTVRFGSVRPVRFGFLFLPVTLLDFRGFDSSRIWILRGGILMSVGNFSEGLSQRISVGRLLAGRLKQTIH